MAQSTEFGNVKIERRGDLGFATPKYGGQTFFLIFHYKDACVNIYGIDKMPNNIPDENTERAVSAMIIMFGSTEFSQITVGGSLAKENFDFFQKMDFESFTLLGAPSNMRLMLSGAP